MWLRSDGVQTLAVNRGAYRLNSWQNSGGIPRRGAPFNSSSYISHLASTQ